MVRAESDLCPDCALTLSTSPTHFNRLRAMTGLIRAKLLGRLKRVEGGTDESSSHGSSALVVEAHHGRARQVMFVMMNRTAREQLTVKVLDLCNDRRAGPNSRHDTETLISSRSPACLGSQMQVPTLPGACAPLARLLGASAM